jgi:hypothetical protein
MWQYDPVTCDFGGLLCDFCGSVCVRECVCMFADVWRTHYCFFVDLVILLKTGHFRSHMAVSLDPDPRLCCCACVCICVVYDLTCLFLWHLLPLQCKFSTISPKFPLCSRVPSLLKCHTLCPKSLFFWWEFQRLLYLWSFPFFGHNHEPLLWSLAWRPLLTGWHSCFMHRMLGGDGRH